MMGLGQRWLLAFIGNDRGQAARDSNFHDVLVFSSFRLLWFLFLGFLLWKAATKGWWCEGWVINHSLRVDNKEWGFTFFLVLVLSLLLGFVNNKYVENIFRNAVGNLLSLTDAIGIGLGVAGGIFVTESEEIFSFDFMILFFLHAIACFSVVFFRAGIFCSAEPVRALFVILMSDRHVRFVALMLSVFFAVVFVFNNIVIF